MNNSLQNEGLGILSHLGLLEKLSFFGETHLVGNMAFETTVKPDIDIQVYPNSKFDITAVKIADALRGVGIQDVIIRKLRISKKTLILGKYSHDNKVWNIDIALTNKSNDYLYDSYRYYLDNIDDMDEEKKELIIGFKEKYCKNKIVFDNPSYYIYKGVLEENIETDEEMESYLKRVESTMKGKK